MPQRDPTVIITDVDGREIVRDEPGQASVSVRQAMAPPPGQFQIRKVERAHHTVFEFWLPDILLLDAPAEVLGMLHSGDLARVAMGLYKLTRQALRLAEGVVDES